MCPVRRAGIRCGDSTTDCLTAAGTRGVGGFAFLRKSHAGCGVPPALRQEPAFESTRAIRKTATPDGVTVFLVGAGGFEPPKSSTTDLQSAPFGHSGTLPCSLVLLKEGGAGRRTRTPDLLITNQLLYQLSYTSTISSEVYVTRNVPICQPLNLFFWRFFILRIVRKRWRDLQRAWPAGLCPRCGMELYPGDLDWVLGGRRLCGACAAVWLAEEAERLAAERKGAVE